ncbi:toxin-antitoxin system YwqK family antitoxin [Akkermansiaceae bacterium]|nr:toxin-antitoxin system YwqK family antitoxin [Akkermansiaceae bacterium]
MKYSKPSNNSVTATMKHLLLMAFAILTIGCGEKKSDGVNVDELEDREGVFYLKLSNTPYTGKSFEFHENGNKKSELTLKEGKIDGLLLQWHANGQKKTEVNFKDGKQHGDVRGWHENGQKKSEETWKDGKQHGLAHLYYENGQMEQESNWKDGKGNGLITDWYEDGQKKAEGNWKDGKEEGPHTHWHENGQKKQVDNWKDGKTDGLTTNWDENGQKVGEVNFKDGKEDGLRVSWYKDGQKEQESNWKDGQMDGTLTLWHKNGKKMAQGTAKGGKSISRQFWNSKGEEVDSMEKAETSGGAERLLTLSVDGVEVTAKRIIKDFPKFEYFYIASTGAFSLDELRIGKTYDSVTGDPSANDPDIIFSDSFDYLEGEKLVDQKGWYSISKPADCYTIHKGSLISDKVKSGGNRLSSVATNTMSDIQIKIPDEVSFENEDSVYLSFLMRPEGTIGVGRWGGYFLVGAKPLDGKGILFGKPGSNSAPDDGKYAIDRQGGPHIVASSVEAEVNKTSFFVVKMESNASGKKVSELKPHAVQFSNLEERKGIRYLKNSDTPYTGEYFIVHRNGQKKATGSFKGGKKDGLVTSWHENGQKRFEVYFKDGRFHGLNLLWHENGQKEQEIYYKEGKKDGPSTMWYDDGQVQEKATYKEDELNGLGINWHQTGKKANEGIFKDGKADGLMTSWYKNGQKEVEGTFKDGKPEGLMTWLHDNGQKKGEANFKAGEAISEKYWNSKGEEVDSLEEAE